MRVFSPEHKAKLSASHKGKRLREDVRKTFIANGASVSARAKAAQSNRGRVRSEEFKRRCSERQLGVPHGPRSEKVRLKIGSTLQATILRKILLYGFQPNHKGRKGWIRLTKAVGPIPFASADECLALIVFDRLSNVVQIGRCPFRILYIAADGKSHNYFPDFLATFTDGTQKIVEYKPRAMLDLPENVLKFRAAEAFCKSRGFGWLIISEDFLDDDHDALSFTDHLDKRGSV